MRISREKKLETVFAKDGNYNGLFITAVLTTNIYCLPSCSARKPKHENIRFFDSENDAKEAGFRACKKCRPDLFYLNIDPDEELAERIAKSLVDNPENYLLMRSYGFADCVPVGDTGLVAGLKNFFELDHKPDVKETEKLMKVFKPYRSFATFHLWNSLEG